MVTSLVTGRRRGNPSGSTTWQKTTPIAWKRMTRPSHGRPGRIDPGKSPFLFFYSISSPPGRLPTTLASPLRPGSVHPAQTSGIDTGRPGKIAAGEIRGLIRTEMTGGGLSACNSNATACVRYFDRVIGFVQRNNDAGISTLNGSRICSDRLVHLYERIFVGCDQTI